MIFFALFYCEKMEMPPTSAPLIPVIAAYFTRHLLKIHAVDALDSRRRKTTETGATPSP